MPSTEVPIKELQDVNWDKLTEPQAAGLGLSLGLFNDAAEDHRRTRAVFLARLSMLVVAALVGGTMLSWSSPVAAVAGICGALSIGTVASWWQTRRSAEAVRQATEVLKADAAELPRG